MISGGFLFVSPDSTCQISLLGLGSLGFRLFQRLQLSRIHLQTGFSLPLHLNSLGQRSPANQAQNLSGSNLALLIRHLSKSGP